MMPEPAADAKLFLGADMSEVEIAAIGGGEVAVFSARCPGVEGPNQDAAALLPAPDGAAVLVVADGAGGTRAGERASSLAVRVLAEAVARTGSGGTLRDAILDGIERANQAVVDLGLGAATTLSVVEIQLDRMRTYHVGDSLILLIGQRGKVKLETVSHSPVGFAVEAGLLDATEAIHHEDRHLVSNLLGQPDMRIEIGSTRSLAPRDTLLLASDGLSDNLHVAEIADCLRKGRLRDAAERLASTARRRMYVPTAGEPSKPDDLTFVAYRRGRR